MMFFNLLKLLSFKKIVDLGSFSKAAESLGITPPAISKQIREHEKFLNVQLLRRNTRSFTLTKAGEEAYNYFSTLITGMDKFCETIANLDNNPYAKMKNNPFLNIRKDDY